MKNLKKKSAIIDARGWGASISAAMFVSAILLLLTSTLITHPPEYDELLHILAARGINSVGYPVIDAGIYTRAELFSQLIAFVTSFGGNELYTARLPALGFSVLLAGLLGGWVTKKAGLLAGVAAGVIFVLVPITLHLSVLVRFYTLHALVVTLIVILAYEVTVPSQSKWFRAICVAFIIFLVPIAYHLHELSVIAFLAILMALFFLMIYDFRERLISTFLSHPRTYCLLFLFVLFSCLFVVYDFGLFDQLRDAPPAWSIVRGDYFGFYFGALGFHMPFLWPLFPILAVMALVYKPRLTLFCLVTVAVVLAVNSIASQKAMRYIYQIIPMICVIWGIGFLSIFNVFVRYTKRHTSFGRNSCTFIVFLIIILGFANSLEAKRALKLLSGKGQMDAALPVMIEPDWGVAAAILMPIVEKSETLVVNSGVKGIYSLGRYDYELNKNVVAETVSGEDFGLDRRTGRQVIGSASAAQFLIDNSTGITLFVLETRYLNKSNSVPRSVVEVLETNCDMVQVPLESKLTVWECVQLTASNINYE